MTAASGSIVVAGALAQKPIHGGHAWVFLQYLLGFRRLGWEVLFIDRLPSGVAHSSTAVEYVASLMGKFGLDGNWALLDDATGDVVGLPKEAVIDRIRRSAFLLNIMGFIDSREILAAAPRRVFLDIDPGFPQMWQELGLADIFAGHDDFVTIGENIGQPGCAVPTCGLTWVTTPQPVVLDEWPAQLSPGRAVTSIASWRGAYGPIDYRGQRYGLRVHEFRTFAALPASSPLALELALSIDAADHADFDVLRASGWQMVEPSAVAGDPWSYRRFIQGSAAELMVAKNMYVRANSGWFSDRSLCYLASGRPVVAQDTGFAARYPTGLGLFAFSTVEEARASLDAVAAEPAKHGQAARELAESFFDSDVVLGRLLSRLGVS
jgi:hypothetical protein